MAGPVHLRIGVRLELGARGEADDVERVLFDGEAAPPPAWAPTVPPPPGTFVHEHGHILADVEHLLLQDQVRAAGEGVAVESTLRLEGHPLHGLAEPLLRAGPPGKAVHRFLDILVKQGHEVVEIYQDPVLRRAFGRAIARPQLLTPSMQRSLLFLVLVSAVWVWVVGLTVLAVVALPGASVDWNLGFTLFFASLGTNLFLPIPMEPLVLASAGALGGGVAVACAAGGKAVGAWIIFSLGPALRKGMLRLEQRSAVTRQVMVRAERFARRFGYVALGAMLAVPFSPFDIVPVYLFSTLGLRLAPFLAAVFVGFGLRLLAVLMLGEALLGLR